MPLLRKHINARDNNIAHNRQAPERHQPKLYHDLLTPTETQAVRKEVRLFADQHVAPVAWEIGHREESVENFPRELFRKMADAGLFRIAFAAEVGGRGLKYPACATAALIEELAYHSNSVTAHRRRALHPGRPRARACIAGAAAALPGTAPLNYQVELGHLHSARIEVA